MPRVSLIERHEWGAKPPLKGGYPRHARKPDRVTVHHVGGSRAINWQGAKTIQAIQRIHQAAPPDGRGWPDGGYHAVVDPFGGAWRINNYWLRSNHAGVAGWNNNTANIGLSLYGNFDTGDVISDAAYETLVKLLADICEEFDIDPMGSWTDPKDGNVRPNIMGHRDNGGVTKTCPGRTIYAILPKLRRDVAAMIEGTRAVALSESLTKPVRVGVEAVTREEAPALRAEFEVQASATPLLVLIAVIVLILRMRGDK